MREENSSKNNPDLGALANRALIYTKLAVPLRFTCLVSRPRLTTRLEQAEPGNVTLITAPAGFGKTTLITEWSSRHSGHVAWLSLDEADNDAVRFWSYVVVALRSASMEISSDADAMLTAAGDPNWDLFVSLLLHDLNKCQYTVTLVLDDYHLIRANAIHYHLGYILRHQPGHLRVIILSRADPPLALARLRLDGRLLELRAADLRFSSTEMQSFFACSLSHPLPPFAIQTLMERIEGWPAGLRLAALSLQELRAAETQAFVDAFSGADRYVFYYLLEEVLHRQPPRIQSFLLQTSILRNLNAQLCAAVTGYDDSGPLLEQMAQESLFVMRLERVADWYRYHRLFAGALRNRLDQTEPNLIPELRRRAADWYEDQGVRQGVPLSMMPALMTERYEFGLEDDMLPIDPLTEREAEILALIAQGLSNQQIADQLVITVGTVKGHISHLFSKLDARSRTQALAKARRLGLLQS